jgi:amino acid transporter
MTGDIGAAVGAAAFWMFIAIVATAGVAGAAFRHHETQKTIRKAIESGQSLDPETLDRLLRSNRPSGPPPRAGFLVGGILMLAIGVGIALIGWFTAQTDPRQLYPGLGAGSLVGLIGLALLLCGLLIGRPGNGQA